MKNLSRLFIPAKKLDCKPKKTVRRCPCSLWVSHGLLCRQKEFPTHEYGVSRKGVFGFGRFPLRYVSEHGEKWQNQPTTFLLEIVTKI